MIFIFLQSSIKARHKALNTEEDDSCQYLSRLLTSSHIAFDKSLTVSTSFSKIVFLL
ncbi:MAG: hypothetical protein L6V91_06750 [Bacilli bacterium]|nr:MAG: hypothetical protein L6V91_06750 [Bacilli bacterium]